MVALPVALATSTATIARTTVGTADDEVTATMGSADLHLSVGRRFETARLEQRLPAGSRAVVLRTENPGFVRQGELLYSTLVEPDPSLGSPVLTGLYELASGDAPRKDGEAAVNPRLLDAFEASLGDDIELGNHVLTVTGLIRTRDLSHPVAVVGSGTLGGSDSMTQVLIDLPDDASPEAVAGRLNHHGITTRDEIAAMAAGDAAIWDAVSLVGGVLGLFATGLIAAAAFVVGARRQLRELGLIGAVGGEPRHVRAVVWSGGTTLGLLGGLVGAGAGAALAFAIHPHLPRFVGREVGPLDLNPIVLLAVVLMGSAAATLAALAPARAAGKVSVVSALAGLSSPPRPPGRIALVGMIALGLGTAITAWAAFRGEDELLAAGLVAMLAGILLAIPLLVSLVGRLATAGALEQRSRPPSSLWRYRWLFPRIRSARRDMSARCRASIWNIS
jgi:putative ABC transport system permease protein